MDYFTEKKFKSVVYFSVCWQLALSANLILVGSWLYCSSICMFFIQGERSFKTKKYYAPGDQYFSPGFLDQLFIFYKEKGVLDYGVGNDYWEVTFKTLMFVVFGNNETWLHVLVILVGLFILGFFIYHTFKNAFYFNDLFEPRLFYPFTLIILVLRFLFQKQVLQVNFPEDRTGLSFTCSLFISFAIVLIICRLLLVKLVLLLFLQPHLFILSFHLI